MMRFLPGCCQDIGQRSSQQDDYFFSDMEDVTLTEKMGVLAILADGMGGLAFGREASRLAVQTIQSVYQERALAGIALPEALDQALRAADAAVSQFSLEKGQRGNVGTTTVAMVLHQGYLHWRSVGDSRLYLWRKPYLVSLTEDHDYGRQLDRDVQAGRIGQEEADRNPERRALTSFVGQGPMELIDGNRRPFKLRSGDRLLACSDGLYNGLETAEISQVLNQSLTPQEAAENTVHKVLARQLHTQDNVTVLVIECDAEKPTIKRLDKPLSEMRPKNSGRLMGFLRKDKAR